jgi:hypothetical protein
MLLGGPHFVLRSTHIALRSGGCIKHQTSSDVEEAVVVADGAAVQGEEALAP